MKNRHRVGWRPSYTLLITIYYLLREILHTPIWDATISTNELRRAPFAVRSGGSNGWDTTSL